METVGDLLSRNALDKLLKPKERKKIVDRLSFLRGVNTIADRTNCYVAILYFTRSISLNTVGLNIK